ncbi:uncharacterized protein A4U43_C01F21940 [Asparagus officinalis]|uniref:Transcription repressor n=1 Tax=Asparagus officinalis TaxID=4686 RepID=A0A5P1FS05_ASPOF|nr:uncharacterized protein A4U43_C01F21940 [Asparagus officinalis]
MDVPRHILLRSSVPPPPPAAQPHAPPLGPPSATCLSGPADFSPSRFTDPPLTAIQRIASRAFFVRRAPHVPIEEARLSAASAAGAEEEDGRTAVVTVSEDPYVDFRRSMQEMVDARHVDPCRPLDWDFLEELLACYLELNERSVHECILRAFMDLTEGLRRQRISETVKRRRRRMDVGKFV